MKILLIVIASSFIVSSYSYANHRDDSIKLLEGQALNGNYYSQYRLGRIYFEEGKNEIALHHLKRACIDGKIQASCDYLKIKNIDPVFDYDITKNTSQLIVDNSSSKTNMFENAFNLFEKKDYNLSFPIFKEYCVKYEHQTACIMLAVSYRDGKGVSKNIDKTLNILSSPILHSNDLAKYLKGQIYEYEIATNQSIDEANKIYNELITSKGKGITEDAKKATNRMPIYAFADKFINILADRYKHKAKADKIEPRVNNIDVGRISPVLQNLFFQWKEPFLQVIKKEDSSLLDTAFLIGKSAVKGFMGDLSFITDAADEFFSNSKHNDLVDKIRKVQVQIFKEFKKDEISQRFINKHFE